MGSNFKSVGWMVASVVAGAAVLSGAGCDTVRAPNSPRIDQLPTRIDQGSTRARPAVDSGSTRSTAG